MSLIGYTFVLGIEDTYQETDEPIYVYKTLDACYKALCSKFEDTSVHWTEDLNTQLILKEGKYWKKKWQVGFNDNLRYITKIFIKCVIASDETDNDKQ